MGPLVDEEADRVAVNGDFQDEVWRGSGLDCGPDHPVVMGVDQRLVQVQHQHLLPDHVKSVPGDRGERVYIVSNGSVLLDLVIESLKG